MPNVYVFIQWGMLIEQLSTMDPKKPIQAVFLDMHQRQLPMGKRRVQGTALPCQHGSPLSAPCVVLAGLLPPRSLGAGCHTESRNRCLLLNTGDSYSLPDDLVLSDRQLYNSRAPDRNFALQFLKQKMGVGLTFNKTFSDS